jgi:biotin-(acetyl-CoA carboxylase) ligase
VRWDTPAGARSGTAAGIADDGALLVNVAGRIERVISGELQWN